jgi:hypothetical protein
MRLNSSSPTKATTCRQVSLLIKGLWALQETQATNQVVLLTSAVPNNTLKAKWESTVYSQGLISTISQSDSSVGSESNHPVPLPMINLRPQMEEGWVNRDWWGSE